MKTFFRWMLALAVLGHVVLALLYARATPFMTSGVLLHQGRSKAIDIGAPDERQHVFYVRQMRNLEGFPVLDPKDPNLGEHYQAHQPPTCYLLAAGWSTIFGDSAMGLRSMNALIGGTTVIGVFCLAWWGFRREDLALAASLFAALLPMNVALSGAVSNDPLLFCLCTWALALAARGAREGFDLRRGMLLGIVVGLAFLTKTTSVALVPTLALGLFLAAKKPSRSVVLPATLVALVMGAAWWMRNIRLYGDPFALKAFNLAFQGSPHASDWIATFGAMAYWVDWVGWWTARSFVGAFGYMDIFLPNGLYYGALVAIGALMLLGFLAALKDKEPSARPVHIMNGAFLLLVVLLFVQFNRTYFQGQARYLFPAIGPLAILVGLGAVGLTGKRPWIAWGALALALLIVNGYVLQMLPEEFARRADQTSVAFDTSKS